MNGGSVPGSDLGKNIIEACSKLKLPEEAKVALKNAVDEAVAKAAKENCDKQDTARRVIKAAGDSLEASGVKGIAEQLNKMSQQTIGQTNNVATSSTTASPKKSRRRRQPGQGEWEDDVDYF